METQKTLPLEILNWREGDPITTVHREFLANQVADAFTGTDEDRQKQIKMYAAAPEELIAEGLASFIGLYLKMDVETLKKEFPETSKGKSLTMQLCLKQAAKNSSENDVQEMGEIT